MDNREIRARADRADWQITLGGVAAIGLVAWRLLSMCMLALREPRHYGLALAAFGEAAVCGLLAWRLHRGSVMAAALLLLIWFAGFAYAWYSSESILPPFFLISLAIAAGLVLGLVGALGRREHASMRLRETISLSNERPVGLPDDN